ncbi:SCP-like protein [Ancylostoma duodenale]|uniref:SCP-like protein n=1 Tax=Ancylostoma duodenale TaxID=51022 RepID=A0A0C2GU59_9BILA|nr:SCP-like protein [Ancylostoma duodenale]
MKRRNWDCNIENNAFLSTCGNTPIPQDFAANSATLSMSGKKCDITENTMTILKKWDSQATAADLSQAPNYDEQKQKEFGIVADVDANPRPECTNLQPGLLGDDEMTYDMQVTAKDMVNYYRNLVATGWAKSKSGYTPTAKAMNALVEIYGLNDVIVYDCDTLGAEAKDLATDCTSNSYTSKIGMAVNYHRVKDLTLSEEQVLEKALSTWYSQLENVDLDEKANYDNNVQTRAPSFANLVVGDATKLGCSVHTCEPQGFSVAVCEFDGTPTDGFPLYTVDKACSGCAAGKSCHKGLPGLCA